MRELFPLLSCKSPFKELWCWIYIRVLLVLWLIIIDPTELGDSYTHLVDLVAALAPPLLALQVHALRRGHCVRKPFKGSLESIMWTISR